MITGKRIYLRELNEADVSYVYRTWLNDPAVNKFLGPKKTTLDELKRIVKEKFLGSKKTTLDELKQYVKERKKNKNCLFMGIFLKENKEHIGNIKLEPIDFDNKRTIIGILIGNKNFWGKGMGTEAIKLLVNYAFSNLGLKEINLGVLSTNKAAIKAYKKAGFQINEIKKKSAIFGSICDVYMSINPVNYLRKGKKQRRGVW